MEVGFKWLLSGLRSSSASAQYPQGYCCGQADRQLDRQTAMLAAQTGIFSPTLCSTEAPRLLGFPSVALQEHPAGASHRSIPQRCHGDAAQEEPRCCTPPGGLRDPLPHRSRSLGCPMR